jgi:lysophospholipase L1-like esterase
MWMGARSFTPYQVYKGVVMIRYVIALVVLLIWVSSAPVKPSHGAENCSNTGGIPECDWPGLEHYRIANNKTAALLKAERRVVFFGDSITELWNLVDYFAGMPYINRGIRSQITSQMLVRFRPDVIALRPRSVVILAGTNDIAGKQNPHIMNVVRDNLSSMAELAQLHSIRVVFASLLPVSDYSKGKEGRPILQTTIRRPEQIKTLNEWIKKYANDNGLTYLDYYNAMVDKQGFLKAEFSSDGLHPNSHGYKVMAGLAEQAITSSLTTKR